MENKIKEIKEYVLTIDYKKLSFNELDAYIKMLIAFKNSEEMQALLPSFMDGTMENNLINFFNKGENK